MSESDDSDGPLSGADVLLSLTQRVAAQEATVKLLVDVLIGKDVLAHGHRRVLDKAAERAGRVTLPQIRLGTCEDKHAVVGPDIDCASLLPLCRAQCCHLEAALSKEDIADGELEWEVERPYLLKRASDGYCQYLGANGGCGCYEIRPGACRKFDCRQDPRIWYDFERKIPAPFVFARDFESSGDE